MRIDGFRIPVSDFAAAVAFYRDGLGFHVVFESEEYGWASLHRNGAEVGLYVPGKGGGNRAPGGTVDFVFVVESFEAYHETLLERGIAVTGIQTTDDGTSVFDVADPDGNEIVVRKG
jgi:catechol 2,3-dioxygenase-like lactoylglutathione lyase family enzyme